jgi:hypothetical protein
VNVTSPGERDDVEAARAESTGVPYGHGLTEVFRPRSSRVAVEQPLRRP